MSVHSMFEIAIASLFEQSFDLTHFQNRPISPLEQSFVLNQFRTHTDYKKKPGANKCMGGTLMTNNNMKEQINHIDKLASSKNIFLHLQAFLLISFRGIAPLSKESSP